MKKSNPKELSRQLMDYRDMPALEIPRPTLVAAPPFALYTNLGEEWVFDLDKPKKIDFEA